MFQGFLLLGVSFIWKIVANLTLNRVRKNIQPHIFLVTYLFRIILVKTVEKLCLLIYVNVRLLGKVYSFISLRSVDCKNNGVT